MVEEETKKAVGEMAEQFGKELKEVQDDFKEILGSPILSHLSDKDKEMSAIRMVKATYAAGFGGRPTQKYQLYVLQKTVPKDVKKKDTGDIMRISNIYCLAVNQAEGDDAPIRYGRIAHFDKSADLVNTVEEGKAYEANLTGEIKDGVFRLSASEITRYKENAELTESFGNPLDVVRNAFEAVEIAEASLKTGGEMKLIEGTVSVVNVITTKAGNKLGMYTIIDDSLTMKDLEDMRGGLTVMVDPAQVKFGKLSQLAFIGHLSNHEQHGVGMMGELILPIIETAYEAPQESVEEADTGLTDGNKNDVVIEDEDL